MLVEEGGVRSLDVPCPSSKNSNEEVSDWSVRQECVRSRREADSQIVKTKYRIPPYRILNRLTTQVEH